MCAQHQIQGKRADREKRSRQYFCNIKCVNIYITLGHFNSLSPYAAPVFMFIRGLAAGEQLTL
jgi:hypothetical protein